MYTVAEKARRKLSRIASHLMDCPESDIVFEEGRIYSQLAPDCAKTFAEIASAAYSEELLPPDVGVGLDFQDRFTLSVPYYNPHSFATHVVVVEVNRDTGHVKIIKYIGVHDCGRIINPMIVEGQVHGAIAPGIGQALTEGMAFTDDGQPLTGSLMDYAVPMAANTPVFETATVETPSPLTPTGAKGVGELPTVAAPAAVANAVMAALNGVGVRHIDTPLTPEKIWRAIHGIE